MMAFLTLRIAARCQKSKHNIYPGKKQTSRNPYCTRPIVYSCSCLISADGNGAEKDGTRWKRCDDDESLSIDFEEDNNISIKFHIH
jgi:hypothetical protein